MITAIFLLAVDLCNQGSDDIWGLGSNLEEIAPTFKKDKIALQPIFCQVNKIVNFDANRFLATFVDGIFELLDKNQAFSWGRNDYLQISSKKKTYFEFKKQLNFKLSHALFGSEASSMRKGKPSQASIGSKNKLRRANSTSGSQSDSGDSGYNLSLASAVSSGAGRVTYLLTTEGRLLATGAWQAIPGLPLSFPPDSHIVPLDRDLASIRIVGIATGNRHALAWDDQGNVFAWGQNTHGCLGVDNNHLRAGESTTKIEIVEAVKGAKVVECFVVHHASFAVTYQGKVFHWGK